MNINTMETVEIVYMRLYWLKYSDFSFCKEKLQSNNPKESHDSGGRNMMTLNIRLVCTL